MSIRTVIKCPEISHSVLVWSSVNERQNQACTKINKKWSVEGLKSQAAKYQQQVPGHHTVRWLAHSVFFLLGGRLYIPSVENVLHVLF